MFIKSKAIVLSIFLVFLVQVQSDADLENLLSEWANSHGKGKDVEEKILLQAILIFA